MYGPVLSLTLVFLLAATASHWQHFRVTHFSTAAFAPQQAKYASFSFVSAAKMTNNRSSKLLATAVAAAHLLLLAGASRKGSSAEGIDDSSPSGTVRDFYVAVELVGVCECACAPIYMQPNNPARTGRAPYEILLCVDRLCLSDHRKSEGQGKRTSRSRSPLWLQR